MLRQKMGHVVLIQGSELSSICANKKRHQNHQHIPAPSAARAHGTGSRNSYVSKVRVTASRMLHLYLRRTESRTHIAAVGLI